MDMIIWRLNRIAPFVRLLYAGAIACGLALGILPAAGGHAGAWPDDASIVDEVTVDVSGDGIKDTVHLLGRKRHPNDVFVHQHLLHFTDGQTGTQRTTALGENSGAYEASLFAGDFNGDGVADLLISMPTGGSGGIIHCLLVTLSGGTSNVLFDGLNQVNGLTLNAALVDGFAMRVEAPQWGQTFSIDLGVVDTASDKAAIYQDVYAASGKLLRPIEGFVDPIGWLEPVDLDGDGTLELVTHQAIWVLFHANTVARAKTVWRWDGSRFIVADLQIEPVAPLTSAH